MALPTPNPIDTNFMLRGAALDHVETSTIECFACGPGQRAHRYRILVSGGLGFGAPWFAKPFLKHASTRGKVGKRAMFAQCCNCTSLWAEDDNAREFSLQSEWGPYGRVADAVAYDVMNKAAEQLESENKLKEEMGGNDGTDTESESKVRKLPSE